MSKTQNPEVPAENPAGPRDERDENPEKSLREWEAFFAAIEAAKSGPAAVPDDDDEHKEAA